MIQKTIAQLLSLGDEFPNRLQIRATFGSHFSTRDSKKSSRLITEKLHTEATLSGSQHILEFCKYLGANSLNTKLTFSRSLSSGQRDRRDWKILIPSAPCPTNFLVGNMQNTNVHFQAHIPSSSHEEIPVCSCCFPVPGGWLALQNWRVGVLGISFPSLRPDLCRWNHV